MASSKRGQKRPRNTPQLTVIARGNSRELVLTHCKNGGGPAIVGMALVAYLGAIVAMTVVLRDPFLCLAWRP